MKRLVSAITICMVLLVYIGCTCNSDVLARYDNKTITRGQFKQWLQDKNFNVESILKSKTQQKDKLENMAIEDIAVDEAAKEQLLNSDKYKFLEDTAYESVLLKKLYDKKIQDNYELSETAYKLKQILIRIKDFKIVNNKSIKLSKDELEKAYAEAENRAKDIIAKLQNGGKFEELARLYSDDFSKKNGGDIGYVVRDMLPPEVNNAIEKHTIGLINTPIRTPNGVYVVQLVEKINLTRKNINSKIKDEMQAKRIEQMMLRKASNNYINELMFQPDVQFNEKNCRSTNQKDIIFKVGDSTFTVGDLEKRISYFNHNKFVQTKPALDELKKIDIAKNAFKVALLKRAALQLGIQNDQEFKKEFDNKKKMLFAREYMDYISEKNIQILPKDVKAEYDNYKDSRFTTVANQKGKQIKQVIPFEKVKEQIQNMLYRKKKSENIATWKKDMFQKYKFYINESELEGK